MDKKIFYEFVKTINDHNIDKICELISDDHKFIDAQGSEVAGKEKVKTSWTRYFQWFPDYRIEITNIFVDHGMIAAFGFASGTFKSMVITRGKNYWRLPASWKAVISHNKVKLCEVYADTKIPFDIFNKISDKEP